jgi:N-acetyl-gamma-glutamyl-phosphate reductase
MSASLRVGIVGARGHVGVELIALLTAHPRFDLAFVSSREWAGQPVSRHCPGVPAGLCFENLDPAAVAQRDVDAVVLALPNGKAADYVQAIDASNHDPVIIDLSADYRFDDRWHYGLPELTRQAGQGARRISNPGCYATAIQLAIAPLLSRLQGPVQCFGVSGYSGAGTSPSERNDVAKLRDNLMPYALTWHVHEHEASRQLGHTVEFMPHVAPHFRGLIITANLHLSAPLALDAVIQIYRERYADEPLIQIRAAAPWVSTVAAHHHVGIGGFTLAADGRRLVLVSVLDNLLKGAATQALQNLNLAFGLDEFSGVPLASSGAVEDSP